MSMNHLVVMYCA